MVVPTVTPRNLEVGSASRAVPSVLCTDSRQAVVLVQGWTASRHTPSQSLSVLTISRWIISVPQMFVKCLQGTLSCPYICHFTFRTIPGVLKGPFSRQGNWGLGKVTLEAYTAHECRIWTQVFEIPQFTLLQKSFCGSHFLIYVTASVGYIWLEALKFLLRGPPWRFYLSDFGLGPLNLWI